MDASGYGAAASVAGGVIQSVAASQAAAAMKAALEKELQNQEHYRNQSYNIFQPALQYNSAENANQLINQGAADRQAYYQKVGQTPLALKSGDGSNVRSKAQYALSGQNRANLGGYSDWALHQLINHIRSQDEMNKISNFAAGDAGVFPYKLQKAQHSQDELAAFGNMISSLGGSASAAGSYFQGPPSQPQQQNYGQFQTYGMPGNSVAGGYDIQPTYYNQFGGQA